MEKIKVDLSGVNETMLVPVVARAAEAKRKNPRYYDEYAVAITEELAYDFKKHKSPMNLWGVSSRTIILDEEAKEYIKEYPDCSVINLACGLDSRFYRVDNGKIHWYNVDFENVMNIRKQVFAPHDRVVNIAGSALDFSWINQVENKENALIITEGFLMYLKEEEVKLLFDTIAKEFHNCRLLCELMAKGMVKNQKMHETIQKTSARFVWGIDESSDFCKLCPQYSMLREKNLTDYMKLYAPLFITLLGKGLRKNNNRIGVFQEK